MVLKIKKYVPIVLGCIFLISDSNAMNSKQYLNNDIVAMQHTVFNVLQMIENTKDPALNNTNNIAGIPINVVNNLFKIDDYKNSPNGNTCKFLNDIIDCLVNCTYENDVNVNGMVNNEYYKELKSIFVKIVNIDYSNLNNAKNEMLNILEQSKSIFLNICKIVKNENKPEYNFINDNYSDYRNLQFKLGRVFLDKTLNNKEWNSNEMLLHKALLLVLYCEEIIINLSLFPTDFPSADDIINGYWNIIFKEFELNASPYFK